MLGNNKHHVLLSMLYVLTGLVDKKGLNIRNKGRDLGVFARFVDPKIGIGYAL